MNVSSHLQKTGRALHKDEHRNPKGHQQNDWMSQAVLLQKVQSLRREAVDCFQVIMTISMVSIWEAIKLPPKGLKNFQARFLHCLLSSELGWDKGWERETDLPSLFAGGWVLICLNLINQINLFKFQFKTPLFGGRFFSLACIKTF